MLLLIGLLMLGAAFRLGRVRRKQGQARRHVLAALVSLLSIVGILLTAGGAYEFWYTHRLVPTSTQQTLFRGVTYIREVRQQPVPMIVYIVQIDLADPAVRFLVTPGEPVEGSQLRARTTSGFLKEFHLQVAINGDYFVPWRSITIFDYYPHVGDVVNALGVASSQGKPYSKGAGQPTLYISKNNEVSFSKPDGEVYNAISGNSIFLQERQSTIDHFTAPYYTDRHPRTAVGLTQDGKTLLLIVVDGRQTNYSEGATLKELSAIAIQYGAYTALNLDGGGSSTLVIESASGAPLVLNSPIDNYLPGRERPVANHLGVYASR